MAKKLVVSGIGCSLVDILYNNVSFDSENFKPYISKKNGDGGLIPGNLVFKSDFEKFSKEDFNDVLKKIVGDRAYDKINIGGPGIVSMIHASQITDTNIAEFNFYGARGNDKYGNFIISLLKETPLLFDNYKSFNLPTALTIVLSDPNYNNGNGERIFVNSVGAAEEYDISDINEDFFKSDIVIFGATALVPKTHDKLTSILKKAKENKCITIVNTVYDFRNEKANPNKKWPLGESEDSYKYIDLLITDKEEALRLSGTENITDAIIFFKEKGVGAAIITSGINDIQVFANSRLFGEIVNLQMPISEAVIKDLQNGKGANGDTTGCGDNFAGGVISSVVSQLHKSDLPIDLKEAVSWGIVSGGTATFYIGGMYREKEKGEKLALIKPYYELYKNQIDE